MCPRPQYGSARYYVKATSQGKSGLSGVVGTILLSTEPEEIDGYLPCDGRTVSTLEYPELEAVNRLINWVPTDDDDLLWDGRPAQFKVPDLRGGGIV